MRRLGELFRRGPCPSESLGQDADLVNDDLAVLELFPIDKRIGCVDAGVAELGHSLVDTPEAFLGEAVERSVAVP